MNVERRKFLQQLAGVCSTGVARGLGVGILTATPVAAVTGATAAAATATATLTGLRPYGAGVRAQVFEVIVRQAMAGAPWQSICKGPMRVNNITEDEIKAEVERRKSEAYKEEISKHVEGGPCYCRDCTAKNLERYRLYNERLAAIPHSNSAPCACQSCQNAVRKTVKDILDELWNSAPAAI